LFVCSSSWTLEPKPKGKITPPKKGEKRARIVGISKLGAKKGKLKKGKERKGTTLSLPRRMP
jgi:hypothetical protein